MSEKCYKCGSMNLIKVLPAKAVAVMPELRKEVEAGLAEVSCGCVGMNTGHLTRCKECGFTWDYLMEKQLEEEEQKK